MNRRVFLVTAAAGVAWGQTEIPAPIRKLKPMLDGVQPITDAERAQRIEKARRLMHENKIDAVLFEPGTSLFYFTGRRGGTSSWVLPANGEPAWFEAAADSLERPRRIAQFLKERGGVNRIGIEERVAFATYDVLSRLVKAEFVSADPVTVGCRMIKSPAEIAAHAARQRYHHRGLPGGLPHAARRA